MQRLVLVVALTAAGCGSPAAPAPHNPAAASAGAAVVEVRFLERDGRDMPWRPITEPARLASLRALLETETARLALDLYALAWEIAPPPELSRPMLFLGVEEGGNHVDVGVELADGTRYPELPYVRIQANPKTFAGTLLHEGGHALHRLLARGGTATTDQGVIAPIDAFLDLSRGVTVDVDAAARWARLHDAAIAVDVATRKALIVVPGLEVGIRRVRAAPPAQLRRQRRRRTASVADPTMDRARRRGVSRRARARAVHQRRRRHGASASAGPRGAMTVRCRGSRPAGRDSGGCSSSRSARCGPGRSIHRRS